MYLNPEKGLPCPLHGVCMCWIAAPSGTSPFMLDPVLGSMARSSLRAPPPCLGMQINKLPFGEQNQTRGITATPEACCGNFAADDEQLGHTSN